MMAMALTRRSGHGNNAVECGADERTSVSAAAGLKPACSDTATLPSSTRAERLAASDEPILLGL